MSPLCSEKVSGMRHKSFIITATPQLKYYMFWQRHSAIYKPNEIKQQYLLDKSFYDLFRVTDTRSPGVEELSLTGRECRRDNDMA